MKFSPNLSFGQNTELCFLNCSELVSAQKLSCINRKSLNVHKTKEEKILQTLSYAQPQCTPVRSTNSFSGKKCRSWQTCLFVQMKSKRSMNTLLKVSYCFIEPSPSLSTYLLGFLSFSHLFNPPGTTVFSEATEEISCNSSKCKRT